MRFHHSELSNTYSIVARDVQTGDLGVAVQTHQMGVGLAVPWLEPGVGAIATQSTAVWAMTWVSPRSSANRTKLRGRMAGTRRANPAACRTAR